MRMILEALANENFLVCLRDIEHCSKAEQSIKRICKLEENLKATLNSEEKELLEKLEENISDVGSINETNRFIYGFQLGALIMIEVFSGRDSLVAGNGEQ